MTAKEVSRCPSRLGPPSAAIMYVRIPPRFGCSAEAAPAPKARKAPNTKFKLERNIHHIGSSLDERAGWPIANLCAALCLPIANSSACPLQHVSSAVALPIIYGLGPCCIARAETALRCTKARARGPSPERSSLACPIKGWASEAGGEGGPPSLGETE